MIRLEPDWRFDHGVVILESGNGSELHREVVNRASLHDGICSLRLAERYRGRLEGPLRLIVRHDGLSGAIRLPLSAHGHEGLAVAMEGGVAAEAFSPSASRAANALARHGRLRRASCGFSPTGGMSRISMSCTNPDTTSP